MSEHRVRRRRVFHIPGYDPMPPRRYRELYRKQGAAQAKISNYTLDVQGEQDRNAYCWMVRTQIDGHEATTRVDVLVWADIVRESMARTIPATYLQMLQTLWIYISSGTLQRLMAMRKGPVLAAFYPVVMLLLQLALAVWLGATVGGLAENLILAGIMRLGLVDGIIFAGFAWFAWGIKILLWLGIVLVMLRFFKAIDGRIYAYYLMHDYAFAAQQGGAYPVVLEARMKKFQTAIARALNENLDEVLIVGHSSGAHIAISLLSDLIRDGKLPDTGPQIGLLTLGQSVPMVSFLPRALRLRRDLALMAEQNAVTWVDVSAPGDGCSFALCDPVAVTGVSPANKCWPLVISAAFTQTLSPARWALLRWRFFRLHFQYLCAFDQPKDYDYFKITAGPLTLADRFAGRKPAKSRIEVPMSKYTTLLS